MKSKFENRYYNTREIKHMFSIKDKTWRVWLYGDSSRKKLNKVDLHEMGVFKVPGTNYHVVDPYKFQEWFNHRIGADQDE